MTGHVTRWFDVMDGSSIYDMRRWVCKMTAEGFSHFYESRNNGSDSIGLIAKKGRRKN